MYVMKYFRIFYDCDIVIMKDFIWNNVMLVLIYVEDELDEKIRCVKVVSREVIKIFVKFMEISVGYIRIINKRN